ncbi:hypothetical protein C8R47DRAFT_1112721 [Mycena vitilis]|nr:hypothetical protein C8R47DRAFT_1112721 [Mycena vitilis]
MDSAGRKPSPNFKTSLMELQRNLKEIEHSWKADLKSLTCRVSFRAALLRTPRFQIKWGCQSFRYECTMHCVRTSIAPFRLLTSEETRGPGSGPRYYRAPSGMDTLFQARSLYGGLIVRDGPREASLSKSEFSSFCLRTSLSSASLEPRPPPRSRPALFKLERLPPSTKFAHHCPSSPQWI